MEKEDNCDNKPGGGDKGAVVCRVILFITRDLLCWLCALFHLDDGHPELFGCHK